MINKTIVNFFYNLININGNLIATDQQLLTLIWLTCNRVHHYQLRDDQSNY